jgi:Ser/Thr protein kinase RdoA (MazF antagonist)
MGLENLQYIEQGGLIPGDLLAEYSALGREISARSVPLFEGVPAIRLHGDFGAHNLLRSERGLVVADFDDFMVGPVAFDLCRLYIGLTTPWGDPERDERARDRATKSFVQGYRDWIELPDEHLRPLEALRGLRHLWNDAWKRARLHDAHFRRARRVMRERSFWLERLDYLRGQSAKLAR